VNEGHYLAARSEDYSAANAKATLQAENWLKGAFSTRFEKMRGDNSLSWGVNLESQVIPWLVIWGDQSKSYRFPTIQELFWTDSALTRSTSLTKETHSLLQVGIRLQSGSMDFDLRAFKRRVENAIVIRPWTQQDGRMGLSISSAPVIDYVGGTAGLRLRVWNLEIAGNLTFTDTKEQGNLRLIVPRITSVSELSFRDQFVGGALDLKTAIRLKAVSHHDGLQFNPQLLAYSQQNVLSEMPGFTTVDFYSVARLGDAYLTLVWENPFNVNTIVVPFYPLMSRNIKLGVNWVFTD
jgi:outer membrane cobalamin receptor